ncbi:hypothetical protein EJB05_12322, partial [Eragrostis curvula]
MAFTLLLLSIHLGCLLPSALAADDQFVFNGFKGANLSLDGMATVTPDGLLMLTNDDPRQLPEQMGRAFYPAPLRFHRAHNSTALESFSTTYVICMIGSVEDFSSYYMAFEVAKSANLTSAKSANNGNATNYLFAVEFYGILDPEFNNMSSNHVGIDVNGLDSVETDNAGYYDDATGAFRNLSVASRKAMQVWVDFDGRAMQVDVTMAPLGVARPKKPLLSTNVNLSSVIHHTPYVGLSSAISMHFCRHYVLGWSFRMNGAAPALNISSLPSLPVTFPKARSKTLEIVLPIASSVLVLAVVLLFLRRRRMYAAEVEEEWEAMAGPHRFSYKDLVHATDGFSDKRLLGIGGFGRVYKGVLESSDKMDIAVKKVSQGSRQGMREFIAEVVSIGKLGHRNLVQLLGYCRHKGELLLVYDHMPNGSLDKYLHDQNKIALSWAQRFRIIKGVASGLLYLHEDWTQVVVHRDVKASNVLLDGDMNGRLSDFGLARLYDHGADPEWTRVAGTRGYMAPELWRTGAATPSTDVFAFGVFVLEVSCGRRPLGVIAPGDQNDVLLLLDWVREHERQGTALHAMDSRLGGMLGKIFREQKKFGGGMYDADEARLALKLGLMCAHPAADARPGMRQVVHYLEGDVPMPEVAPTYMSYNNMLALAQNDQSNLVSTGVSAVCLSGGR